MPTLIKHGFQVVDAAGLPLSGMCTTSTIAREAKRIATERKAIVYYLGDNGRQAVEPTPSVDCGATLCYYTDRHAGTVIAVSASGRKITIREDKSIRTDDHGMSESQAYRYERDPDGRVHVCYLRKDGRYHSNQGPRVIVGLRNAYHDYSF